MEGNAIVLFENLCNIFEMRIKLDREKGVMSSLDVLNNYDRYAKKIDVVYNNEFQKDLKPFMSPAVTLEKERDRLRRLIDLLENRIERRTLLEERYYNTTGKYITGLQMIVSEEELREKKERLSLITRYLETSEEIDSVTDSINELKRLFLEEEEKKVQYESKNSIMEDELYSAFKNVIKDIEYYNNVNEDKITEELDLIKNNVIEAKETLDITRDSVSSLITNGLEDDYASYVEEAERNYYSYKNKEIILKIYKLVSSFEEDFKLICGKRENINDLLLEKQELSENLIINVDNELVPFTKVILSQTDTLNNEKEVLDNINNYNSRISFKEERLEELREVNNSVEILSILREYGLIETYDTTSDILDENSDVIPFIEVPSLEENNNDLKLSIHSSDELISDDNIDSVEVETVYEPYRIVDIIDYPKTLNVGLARLKGESVREKVNKKLNPKQQVTQEKSAEVELIQDIGADDTSLREQAISENKIEEIVQDTTTQMPVWELPTEVEVKSPVLENEVVNSLPVWEAIEPIFDNNEVNVSVEDKATSDDIIDLNISNNVDNSNMFWIPVSDSKLETKDFTSMSKESNNFNNSGFVFPTINN